MASPFGAGALALTLAGSGALLALQFKVTGQCMKPSELASIGAMNDMMPLFWWLALASSIGFSFSPDDERVVDGEDDTRTKAAFATHCFSGAVIFVSSGFTIHEAFACDMVDWHSVRVFRGCVCGSPRQSPRSRSRGARGRTGSASSQGVARRRLVREAGVGVAMSIRF